ncbi:alpha/beta fold hydrolase [Saccharothrix coeruleofusca]|uniref:Alpha/beta hydrolase n=1 Tax=Saccharothrix coeruleofusca TaxID=33919 RepID=A0A918ANL5_9PSEU|nr:alpha/beta hydrolase [Saccharothrix coeruleofusca]MBP2340954.1 pimeloyl-ACP methyl ester carboxylesterase [Saccharothrix coeruleofusca]GGP61061.1 alpha/beta hydrolase [Saccharothrix coeruleofusca]
MHSQLSPHHAQRVDLPGRHGPVAALRAPATGPDLGATALLVPGYTGSKEDFAPLLDPIAEAGLEAVAIDLPGQYESAGPAREQDYHPAPLGAALAELVEKLASDGRRVLLLGHSYGGLVARGAVLAGAPVSGLTLMASGPSELPPGLRRTALDQGELAMRDKGLEEAQRINEARLAHNPRWAAMPQRLKDFYRERFLRSTPEGLLGMGAALRAEPDLVAKLGRALHAAGVPCLVVCGELDDAWSAASQRDMAERLDADFAVLPGVLHSPNTEAPEALLGTLLPTWRTWLEQ